MQRAGVEAEPWEGAPLGMAHTPVLTDTLFPLQEPVTVIKSPSHPSHWATQREEKHKRSKEFAR